MDPFFHGKMPEFSVNGTILNFDSIRVSDPHADTLLIFLHEALGSIPQWRDFPRELCDELRLNGIVYERQGHGKSSSLTRERDENYLHHYAWKELPNFIDAVFAPEQKIILVGHSDGGTIALLYASRFPKNVEMVITMAAHVINEQETIAGIEPAVKAFKAGKLARLNDFHGDKTEDLFFAWADTWGAEFFRNWNITQDIHGVQAPVLAIQGANDQYGTIRQLELIEKHVSALCHTILLNNCGHHPHLEQKAKVIELIRHFKQTTAGSSLHQ